MWVFQPKSSPTSFQKALEKLQFHAQKEAILGTAPKGQPAR